MVLFGFVVACLPNQFFAVVVIPSLDLLWAPINSGKNCQTCVVAYLVPSFSSVDGLSRKPCVYEGCFPPVKPWKERGTPQVLCSHGFLTQFDGMDFLRISFVYGSAEVISAAVVLGDGFSRLLSF